MKFEIQEKYKVKEGNKILPQFKGYDTDYTFFNSVNFFMLLSQWSSINAVVFTFNTVILGNSIKFNKVVANKLIGNDIGKIKFRLCKNIHTKLYLCYNIKGVLTKVYMGSQNFNSPTYLETMTSLRESDYPNAERYFEDLWNALI